FYRTIGTTSVVAELIGIGDTAIFRPTDALRLLNAATLERRRFPVLEFLAMQAAQFATPADSALQRVVTQRVMRALERRAATDYERALGLRWTVAAHLAAGRADSARARIARAAPGSAAREGDAWIGLAHVTGLEPLGDWRRALDRLETWATSPTGSRDATAPWIPARDERATVSTPSWDTSIRSRCRSSSRHAASTGSGETGSGRLHAVDGMDFPQGPQRRVAAPVLRIDRIAPAPPRPMMAVEECGAD